MPEEACRKGLVRTLNSQRSWQHNNMLIQIFTGLKSLFLTYASPFFFTMMLV